MDPKRRVPICDALKDTYFQDEPKPVDDVFSCFKSAIPFALRQFLPKKMPTIIETTTTNYRNQNERLPTINSTVTATATAIQQPISSAQIPYICKPFALPMANVK